MKACPERSAALALLRKYNAEPFHIQPISVQTEVVIM